ncbi:Zn-dependent alcohol dehydrogenase [Deinococcus sp.]|uniref:Zn-dependent alcohol dehydrogenase n=1 Tax=Deinococcus sp. TaxID=47478 RepID=UPI0025B9A8D7|nr:Zn-dependent alcohol dehydrogenase [Deinococcus sp.]
MSDGGMTVRAAVLAEVGQPVQIQSVQLAAPGPGQARVRVVAAGLCHSDLSVVNGTIPQLAPLVLGHEGAGIVEAVGEAVTRVKPGDRVIFNWVPSCGECFFCKDGRPDMCDEAFALMTMGTLPDGTTPFSQLDASGVAEDIYMFSQTSCLAEHTVVPETALVPFAEGVPFEVAAIAGCAVMTGYGAVMNTAGGVAGRRVAVIGCGGVGLNVIQAAKLDGATRVIALDRDARKLEDARAFGATDVIDTSTVGDPISAILDMTDGLGADDTFEVVGHPETISLAYGLTRKAGKVVVVGVASPEQMVELGAFSLPAESKLITGSWYGQAVAGRDLPLILEKYRAGGLKLDELISHRYKLDELPQALEALERGELRRGVILMGEQP